MVWPATLGAFVAFGTAYGFTGGRDLAPVVAASGLVYLAAAAADRREAAWVAFGVTFVLIAIDKVTGLDSTVLILVLAGLVLAYGLARRRTRPWWSLPIQTLAMVILGAVALLTLQLTPTAGGVLVAAALVAHAVWDIIHLRSGRVVGRAFATFCAALDLLLAVLVGVVALGP
jgi:hypothetical protein